MRTFVTPHGTQSLLRFIEEHQDKRLIVEIRPYKKPRSQGLNAYAHGYVVTPLANFVGESPDRMWEIMCGEYFGWVEKVFRGHKYKKPHRTTTTNERGERDVLNYEEMQNFVHFCESTAAEINCPLPKMEAA